MGRNAEVARERAGYRLAEHREAGRPRTPHAFCQASTPRASWTVLAVLMIAISVLELLVLGI
jgi:hypothetical protein